MEQIAGFPFQKLVFDKDGQPSPTQSAGFIAAAKAAGTTDLLLLAHGFRNDEADATRLYSDFMTSFQAVGPRDRKFTVGGVYWPSKAFRESFGGVTQSVGDETETMAQVLATLIELGTVDAAPLLPLLEGSTQAQDEFVDRVLSVLDGADIGEDEGLDQIRTRTGSELLEKLDTPIVIPLGEPIEGEGGALGVGETQGGGVLSLGSFVGSIAGKVGMFLNMTSWYLMKSRSGTVGQAGVAQLVKECRQQLPGVRIHLAGHSLGGRLMASCCNALADNSGVRLDSVSLLEAAFSHFGFSAANPSGKPGFFRNVMAQKVVQGPLISTFSSKDEVVGTVYAIASRLAGDNTKAIGDANDPFGGIGRNGTQRTAESAVEALHSGTDPYRFRLDVVNNLDGSANLINNHGDVTNVNVARAVAAAIAAT